jgi:hypothetical protein
MSRRRDGHRASRLFDEERTLRGADAATKDPTWSSWRGIVLRATVNVTDGAAVQCDPRWLGLGGFGRFLADMGARPSAKHRLARVDDGPYTKDTCAWRQGAT